MNIRNKKLNGVIIALIFVAILVATGPLNKVMKRVLNDLNDLTGNHTYLTASFKYLDNENKEINSDEEIYVFISKGENGDGNRITLTLKANADPVDIKYILDQNGNSNSNINDLNGEYNVVVAVPNASHQNEQVKENSKYDRNNYDTYKNNDSYNGSYIITYQEKINISLTSTSNLEVKIQQRTGKKLLASKILEPMGLATNFGIFTLDLEIGADVESTIAAKKVSKIGNNFGLSDNNYKGLNLVNEKGKVVINSKCTKDGIVPLSEQKIKIGLKKLDNDETYKFEECLTNENGECSVTFDNLDKGIYNVFQQIDENNVSSNSNITKTNGDNIEVKFSSNVLNLQENSDINKANYNYNYVGMANSNDSQVDLIKMLGPGTLVVGDETLYNKYSNNHEFEKENKKIEFVRAGINGYKEINFEDEFSNLNKLSIELANVIDSQDVKVYYTNHEKIKPAEINFKVNNEEYILVNVDCTNTNEVIIEGRHKRNGTSLYQYTQNTNGVDASFIYDEGAKIIYNFYTKENGNVNSYSGSIKINGQTSGIILAPSAIVNGATGNHAGTIISKEYHHTSGEVHQKVKPKWISGENNSITITNNLIENDEPKEPTEPVEPDVPTQPEEPDEPTEPEEPDTPQEEEKERNVNIGKVDANKNLIEGAELELRDKDGNVIDSWTSTTELHKIIKELVIGEVYTVHEVKAPEGYQLADDYTFIYNGEENIEYAMVNTKVIVNKLDENQSYLPGAELRILDSEGSIVEQWVTDDKEHYVNHQLKVGETYTLHEEKAPEGYKIAEDVKFVYEPSNENQVVEMKDQKIVIGVFIEKKNMNDEFLSGAHLQVLDSNGNIVDNWVSDNTVHKVNVNLNIGETYTLHEEAAPEGYEVSPDVSFEVKNTEEPQIITMTDNKIIIPGEPTVVVSKKDEENKFLEGAQLQILDKDGKVIEEWITNDKEHTVEVKLTIGETYTLHEVLAPKGYKVSDDVEFTVKGTSEVQEVKMIDKRIRRVLGIVETLDKLTNYLTIFFVSLSVLLISFIIYSKYNKKKLSE